MTGRPPSRFCKWGHDKEKTGKYADGSCIQCRVVRKAKPLPITLEDVERDIREMRERVARRNGVRFA